MSNEDHYIRTIAEGALAAVGVNPDSRVLYDDELYNDALAAATLAIYENKGKPLTEQREVATIAVRNTVRAYNSERLRTVSLDRPIPGTDGLTYAETLEGDWY